MSLTRERSVGTAVTHPRALVRSELLRMRSRRLIVLLLAVGLLGVVAAAVVAWGNSHRVSADDLAAARAQAAQVAEQCRQANASSGMSPADLTQTCTIPPEAFLAHRPLQAASALPDGATGVGVAFAVIGFLVGCTTAGAEWSTRTLPLLLTWEPRRVRLALTKLLVLVAGALVAAVVAQALWTGLTAFSAHTRGVWDLPSGFWSSLLGRQARVVVLAGVAAAGGWALAQLVRNTGAALGVAFVYLAIAESALRRFVPPLRPFLLAENVAAWVSGRGIDVVVRARLDPATGYEADTVVHLSVARAGVTLALGAALLVALAVALFRRRDLT